MVVVGSRRQVVNSARESNCEYHHGISDKVTIGGCDLSEEHMTPLTVSSDDENETVCEVLSFEEKVTAFYYSARR